MADASSGLSADTSSYGGYGQTNKLLAAAGNGPENLNGWLQAGRQQQALQIGRQQLTQQQIETGQKQIGALNGVLGGVLADPTFNNASQSIAQAVKAGVIRPEDAAAALQQISAIPGVGANPDTPHPAIKAMAYDHIMRNAAIDQQLQASGTGAPQLVNLGGSVQPVVPQGGLNPSVNRAGGGPLPLSQSPDSLGDMVTVTDASGTPRTMTRAQAQQQAGYAGAPTGVDYARAARFGVSIGPDGRPVYGGTGTPMPPGTQPGDVVSPPPIGGRAGTNSRGPTVAGPGVGMQPAPSATPGIAGPSPMLGAGLKAYQDDQANASAKMDGVRTLMQALPLVQALGDQGQGPGSEAFNKAKSALVTMGIINQDTADTSAYQEAAKYLRSYAGKSALAARSDMGQLQAEASNPNLQIGNRASVALAQNAIAADRMDAARPKAFEATGNDNLAGYGAFKAGYTQGQDLRAYKIDLMPQADRAALIAQMKAKQNTPEGRRFWQSLQNAHNSGVLTGLPTGGTNGQ